MMARPVGTTKNRRALKKAELKKFIVALLKDDSISEYRKEYTHKAVILLYHGGFRVSEITKLTCEELCDAVKYHRLELGNNTKTKRPRTVLLTHSAVEEISTLFAKELEYCGDKYLFSGRGGSYSAVSVSSFTQQLNALLKKYLDGNYTTHSFRSGLVTDLIASRGVKFAQQIIGHSDIATTLKYQAIEEIELIDAMEDVRG